MCLSPLPLLFNLLILKDSVNELCRSIAAVNVIFVGKVWVIERTLVLSAYVYVSLGCAWSEFREQLVTI